MYKNIFSEIFSKLFSFGIYSAFFIAIILIPLQKTEAQSTSVNSSAVASECQKIASGWWEDTYQCREGKVFCTPWSGGVTGGSCYTESTANQKGWSVCVPGSKVVTLGYADGFDGGECIGKIGNFIFWAIFRFLNWMAAIFLWIASVVFDFTMYFTVVKFKANFSDLGVLNIGSSITGGVSEGLIYFLWGIIRDFLNIILFVTIMYHAVVSMFEGFENTRRKFIGLLIFSIIVNFSLLFVKIAIDVSNILTLQAYTLAVKPLGTSSFAQFRDFGGTGTKSFGEYIMNSVDLDKITNANTSGVVAKIEVVNMQNTAAFQLGRLIIFCLIIYLLLFMSGLLLVRAFYFILAMIMSPLLAADIFFEMWGKGGAKDKTDVGAMVRKMSMKIRGDFYEGLVKGPLLLFFMFLIGVFAENLMSQGLFDNFTSTIQSAGGANSIPSVWTQNLFVFIKFALFFVMCQVLFKKLMELKFEGSNNMMNRSGGWFANKLSGNASRLVGLGLQNTLGRTASNRSSFVGRNLNKLQGSDLIQNWKNADGSTIMGSLQRKIGGGIFNGAESVKTGSYDAGNLAAAIDKKIGNRLSKGIQEATGNSDFGKRVTDSISDRDKKALEEREKKRDEEIKAAKEGKVVTEDDEKKAAIDTKVKFDKGEYSLKDIDEAKGSPNGFTNTEAGTFKHSNGVELTGDEFRKLQTNDPAILSKIEEGREKSEKKANEIAQKRADKTAEEVKKTYEQGYRGGVGMIAKTKDILAGRDGFDRQSGTSKDLQISTVRGTQKAAKEKVNSTKKVVSFITENFYTSANNTMEDLAKIKKLKITGLEKRVLESTNPTEKLILEKEINDTRNEIDKQLDVLGGFVKSIGKYYTSDPTEKAEILKKFDDETFKTVLDANKKAHELTIKHSADIGLEDGIRSKEVSGMIKNFGKRAATLEHMEDAYKKAKPDKTAPPSKPSDGKKEEAPKKEEKGK